MARTRAYEKALADAFVPFPDSWAEIRDQGLGYFRYSLTPKGQSTIASADVSIDQLVADGLVCFDPIVYEDFLPVSAAGIFQSNLGDEAAQDFTANPNQQRFERDLGASVFNEFDHYAGIEAQSMAECRALLTAAQAAE